MKPNKRQKLCSHCEGEVDLDVIVCPYCAADLRSDKPELRSLSPSRAAPKDPALQQTMDSLYPSSHAPRPVEESPENAAAVQPIEEPSGQSFIWPTILFTLGVQICLMGLMMLLFSHKGTVVLSWNATFWFLYVFASIPFLVFGYRALSKL